MSVKNILQDTFKQGRNDCIIKHNIILLILIYMVMQNKKCLHNYGNSMLQWYLKNIETV